MPLVGHLAENGLVIGDEFREGNVAPAARNLEFIKHREDPGKGLEGVQDMSTPVLDEHTKRQLESLVYINVGKED